MQSWKLPLSQDWLSSIFLFKLKLLNQIADTPPSLFVNAYLSFSDEEYIF
jgi:hypothetical protein